MADRAECLETSLGYRFKRPALLRQALTHSSTITRKSQRGQSNERLEFLGDRVLGVAVARMLYESFPDEEEGDLARRLATLVSGETLARVSEGLGLGRHLKLSRGEERAQGRQNPGILADTCEAVVAAIFLDGGFQAANRFVRRHWAPLMAEASLPPKDAKTALQEWAQAHGLGLPRYRETARRGPAHAPTFSVSVALAGLGQVTASGASKKAAEQAAAQALLERGRKRYGD